MGKSSFFLTNNERKAMEKGIDVGTPVTYQGRFGVVTDLGDHVNPLIKIKTFDGKFDSDVEKVKADELKKVG